MAMKQFDELEFISRVRALAKSSAPLHFTPDEALGWDSAMEKLHELIWGLDSEEP